MTDAALSIEAALNALLTAPNLAIASAKLAYAWETTTGVEAVEPILRFMEANPGANFGTPGPLVHFVERYFRNGYEERLAASLQRQPTSHTLWMLNRLINGVTDTGKRDELIALMRSARDGIGRDARIAREADQYLGRLGLRHS